MLVSDTPRKRKREYVVSNKSSITTKRVTLNLAYIYANKLVN